MNIKKLGNIVTKPELYTKGNANMWTDPYISKFLLDVHINPEINLGSRTKKILIKQSNGL